MLLGYVASEGQIKGNELNGNVALKPSQCSGVSLLTTEWAKHGVTELFKVPAVEFSLKWSLNLIS